MSSVAFASTHGACAHYRAELPSRVLGLYAPSLTVVHGDDLSYNAMLGSPIGIYHELGDQRDHEDTPFYEPDVIVLAGSYPRGVGADIIRVARAHGQRVICDCDDEPELPPDNPHYTPDGAELKIAALRAASAVTVSTPVLQARMLSLGINATLIRNTIERDRYRFARMENTARLEATRVLEQTTERPNGGEPIVIGYRGLLAGFHDDDVRTLAGQLPTGDVMHYVHIGADPRSKHTFAELAELPPEMVTEVQAVDFRAYGPQLAGVDVALIPLARRPFSDAKSAIAALEWSAAGVPWIASAHPEFIRAGNGVGLAYEPHAWGWHLGELYRAESRHAHVTAQYPPSDSIGGPWSELVLAVLDRPA